MIEPYVSEDRYQLYHGNCLDVLREMPDSSIDAICTDPPYGLADHPSREVAACLTAWLAGKPYKPKGKGFMGKTWDAWVPGPEVWRECLRVLKPGGHLLAFAGTRSMDLMSMAVRLAGFELRDSIGWAHDGGGAPLLAWTHGQGFPKSRDISKAIDLEAGVKGHDSVGFNVAGKTSGLGVIRRPELRSDHPDYVKPQGITPEAQQWAGFGTALKPSWEPIILARKPISEDTVAANVLEHGTGAINIDGCRVGAEARPVMVRTETVVSATAMSGQSTGATSSGELTTTGRWPANLCHDGSDEVVGLFPQTGISRGGNSKQINAGTGRYNWNTGTDRAVPDGVNPGYGDTGSAARFFYCAKANKKDRNEGLNGETNNHPTVKPTDLMRYLCRLITPPGGTVLDPFLGSGTTGKAALLEGFNFVGIEMEETYLDIAQQRIQQVRENQE
jgi:hypothetical protein